ncbi:MAG: MFS family permease [Alteromonadaceae bacterium]|mgnify:CR=1 FL=1|jgi:MFS family permease
MIKKIKQLPQAIKQYLVITASYWAFTLTDGALRMLILLHFHQLGYSPLALASLFIFYEIFGVITNLVGGWLGAKIGLNKTMNIGLFLQVSALIMLVVPTDYLTITWVMLSQAISGMAKDLNKMSAKSSIKTLVPNEQQGQLFHWVALLTGSKNALKGFGFFLGAFLLAVLGFKFAIATMAISLAGVAIISSLLLTTDIGKANKKVKFSQLFSKNSSLNYLSAARLCLFASRDVWFVVALPVYLSSQLNWSFHFIGTFMAVWIIFYGLIQANTPKLMQSFNMQHLNSSDNRQQSLMSSVYLVVIWGSILTLISLLIALALSFTLYSPVVIVIGLLAFGFVFAINSSLHSYLIVAFARDDGVSMDVGFYYMANALGRLMGTLLSGWIYQYYGFYPCLIFSALLACGSVLFIKKVI